MRLTLAVALLLAAAAGAALASVPARVEGAVTMLLPGAAAVVVCATSPPYACHKLSLFGGTHVVSASTGKPAKLAVGEYVMVDVKGTPGSVFAVRAEVSPDRFVRTLPDFKAAQAPHLANALRRIPGVRSARLIPALSEAVIDFDARTTSPAKITQRASRAGVRLSLPQ